MRLRPKSDPEIVYTFVVPCIVILALLKWIGLLG